MPKPTRITSTVTKTARPMGGIASRIKSIGFDDSEGIKMLLYGQSGSGKTTTWATFPKPIIAAVCSGGNKPGELRSIDTEEYRDTISAISLESSEEMISVIEYVRENPDVCATLVLDHCSGLQDKVLAEILGMNELPTQKSWGMATQQQYGQCVGRCKDLFRSMLDLPMNVIFVAQERVSKEDGDSDLIAPSVGANLMPSLAGWLNPAVDYICRTEKRPKERVEKVTVGKGKDAQVIETRVRMRGAVYALRTGPDSVYVTKFRLPKGSPLPDYIVDPSYDKIMALIRGEEYSETE